MVKSNKSIFIGELSVRLPAGLKALPAGFRKTYVAKCKELNSTMKSALAEIAGKGTTARTNNKTSRRTKG